MSDASDVEPILDAATRAAASRDWTTAEKCLRLALRIQEVTLGPTHPDLIRTLGRLASICEVARQFDQAEAYYRKALAIASVTFAPGDAVVATTRENLRQFCLAHDVPLE